MTTRFMIITSPRCGTHLVGTALTTMVGVGESYEAYNNNHWKFPPHTQKVWDKMWSAERQGKFFRACGFILHRNQGGLGDLPGSQYYDLSPWLLLRADKSIKIIELIRRSWLKRFVSLTIALRTQIWNIRRSQDPANFCLKVNLNELSDFVKRHTAWEKTSAEYLAGHERSSYVYEDIVADPDTAFSAIQDFLGLPREEIAPAIRKQEKRHLSEVVTNYDEALQFLLDEFGFDEEGVPEVEV